MPPKFYKKKYTKTPYHQDDFNTSATYLIIVESPSKCKKIEGFLGSDYCCIASKGHIRNIEGLKSIDTKNTFQPKFSIIDEKKGHVEFMKNIVSRFSKSNVILASDDDREGEAIAWHICEVFDLPVETTKRILFHEITKNAIIDAVKKPTIINMSLVQAQHARQVLDMVVGYKISPFLWKYLYQNKDNSLSAGRCQTPALRLVYDNEKEKREVETKYKTMGNFFSKNISFELNHEFVNPKEVYNFLERSNNFVHKMNIGSQRESKKSPPKPFNTSRLLQTASNMLHISPKETMSICQTLYQNGHITYMRTDSMKYSNIFIGEVKKLITDTYQKPEYIGNVDSLENKDISNPHEAIRVTHLELKNVPDSENNRINSLYKLIWRNSIESCMSDAVYNCTTVNITAPIEKLYQYTVEVPVFLGWKKLTEKTNETESQNDPSSLLLFFKSVEHSEKINYNSIESTFVARNKHQHYTEATLISTLEDLSIGRPSTFASIVDTIQERGYVKRMDLEGEKVKCIDFKLKDGKIKESEKEKVFGNEKNKLVLQPVGLITLEFLIEHFQPMFSYEYTKNMENKLDEVSNGIEKEWALVCKECYNEIKELSKPIAKLNKQVFQLDEENDFIFEKYGPVIRKKLQDGTFEYKNVKKDIKIDLEKLKEGGYRADELYEIKNNMIGTYEDHEMYIKSGQYGAYVEWGEKRESIKKIEKPLDTITLDDVIDFLGSDKKSQGMNVLRVLTPSLSVRKGKFGPYVYYKTHLMSKPDFFNIKKFPEGFLGCQPTTMIEWLNKTYNINIE
jgi:DNA topoisomerase-1